MDIIIVYTIVGLALAYIGKMYFKKFVGRDKSPQACGCASCTCSDTCNSFGRQSAASKKK